MKRVAAVLTVKFHSYHSPEHLMKMCQEDLDTFKRIPGLVQKYYVNEESTGAISGIYLFETKEARNAFQASELAKVIPDRYGVIPETLRAEEYEMALVLNEQVCHLNAVMEENFAYNLKLEDYAQLCNMSLSTFKKSFKQHYKTTPAAWLKDQKLNLALEKVLSSNLNIKQISFECGFEDTSHFIRVFKEKYNRTPRQYRQNNSETSLIEHRTVQPMYSTF